jgi:hypothetical protein
MTRREYIVSIREIDGVSEARMKAFIHQAVACWGGQFEPRAGGDNGNGTFGTGDPLGPPCVLAQPNAVQVRRKRK